MTDENTLKKAIDATTKATEDDIKGEYESALKNYLYGIELFHHYLKYNQKNEKVRATIIEKCSEYLARAENLKKHLNEKKGKEASGVGDVKKAKNEESNESQKFKDQLKSTIAVEKPDIKWDDVAGLEGAKQALFEAVVLPLKFPTTFTGKRRPWKGILLFGPPGTGKSYIAKAVASEANNCTFISLSSSDVVSKWVGDSEKLIRAAFELARENKPTIIFIDEIDSICSARSENENESARRIKTEFLVQMDGFPQGSNQNSNDGILVLGATNIPWVLDSGIRRRFEKRIYIPLPDEQARVKLFQKCIGNTPNTLKTEDFIKYAKMTDGYSGADISITCREALMEPLRLVQTATHFKKTTGPLYDKPDVYVNDFFTPCLPSDPNGIEMNWTKVPGDKLLVAPVTDRDILKAISRTPATVKKEECLRLMEFSDEFGVKD